MALGGTVVECLRFHGPWGRNKLRYSTEKVELREPQHPIIPSHKMSFRPHLTVSDDAVKRDLIRKFVAVDPEEFLMVLYPLMSETQWDHVKENWITTLILVTVKQPLIEQIITDMATDADHMNLIVQDDKGERLQVFTAGDPRYTRFVFMRTKKEDAKVLEEQLCNSESILIQFV